MSIKQYRGAIANANLKTIVLDNGAYEGEIVSDGQLVNVIQDVAEIHKDAKIYPIIPDEMKDPEKTVERVKAFFTRIEEIPLPENVSFLGVIQVNPGLNLRMATRHSFSFALKLLNLAKEYNVQLGGFAIPIWFYRRWKSRDCFARVLRILMKHAYLHALGLDDINEVRQLRYLFNSFDSTMPFTLAYYGKTFDQIPVLDLETKKRLGIGRVPLKEEVPENDLYMKNLEYVLKVCNGQ